MKTMKQLGWVKTIDDKDELAFEKFNEMIIFLKKHKEIICPPIQSFELNCNINEIARRLWKRT